jgi:membrane protease YdiL (CAAX protease family)
VQAWAAFLSQHLFGTIIFVAIGALAEEMLFRGALQHELGKWPSIILFALAHGTYFSVVQLLGALLAGIILAQMRERTQSIFPGFISHAAYNLVAVFFLSGI